MNEKLSKIREALTYIENLNIKETRSVNSNDLCHFELTNENKTKTKIKSYRMQEEYGEKKFIKP